MMSNTISRFSCGFCIHASLIYWGENNGPGRKIHNSFTVAANLRINHELGKYKRDGFPFYTIWSIYGQILEKILCPVLEILNLK